MHWILEVFKKYAVFEGRARRKEYWSFALFVLIVMIALYTLDSGDSAIPTDPNNMGVGPTPVSVLIFTLITLLPQISVGVRRLHDTGRNGWWILLGFIPFVGSIALIVLFALDSQPGSNQYGPNPKGINA